MGILTSHTRKCIGQWPLLSDFAKNLVSLDHNSEIWEVMQLKTFDCNHWTNVFLDWTKFDFKIIVFYYTASKPWSKEEQGAVLRHLGHLVIQEKLPGKHQCEEVKKKSQSFTQDHGNKWSILYTQSDYQQEEEESCFIAINAISLDVFSPTSTDNELFKSPCIIGPSFVHPWTIFVIITSISQKVLKGCFEIWQVGRFPWGLVCSPFSEWLGKKLLSGNHLRFWPLKFVIAIS